MSPAWLGVCVDFYFIQMGSIPRMYHFRRPCEGVDVHACINATAESEEHTVSLLMRAGVDWAKQQVSCPVVVVFFFCCFFDKHHALICLGMHLQAVATYSILH